MKKIIVTYRLLKNTEALKNLGWKGVLRLGGWIQMKRDVGSYYNPPEEDNTDTSIEEDLFCDEFFREVEKRIKWDKQR